MRLAAVIVLLAALSGCAGPDMRTSCWLDAVYAYTRARMSGYPAEVLIQKTPRSGEGIYHAQAAAYIDGKWQWLNLYG